MRVLPAGGVRLRARAGSVLALVGANGTDSLTISPGGNVGVGYANPVTQLQIGAFQHFFSQTISGVNRYALVSNNLKYGVGGLEYVNNGAGLAMILGDQNGDPKMQFLLFGDDLAGNGASTSVNRMNLSANGLSIGRDNASAALHITPYTTTALRIDNVEGSGEIPEFQMEGGTDNEFLTFRPNASMTTGYALTFPAAPGVNNQFLRTDGAGNLSWATVGGADNLGNHTAAQNLNLNGYQLVGTGGSGLYVDGIGNVGIGTTTPGEKLVVKTSSNNDGISMINAANNNTYLRFWENGGPVRGVIMVRNDNFAGMEIESQKIAFNTGNLGDERMVITSGGAVGIGTSSPAAGALLDVAGQVKIGGGSPGLGKVLTSDATGLATWTTLTNSLTGTTGISNTFLGQNAGTSINIGTSNTFVGQGAGTDNSDGSSNTFVGLAAGGNTTTGNNNTFIGASAGSNTTTGAGNIALGAFAGQGAIVGNYNILVGELAGNAVSNGNGNIFVGNSAGSISTTASNQIAIGSYALQNLSFNNSNTAWPANNIAIGAFSLSALDPTGTTDGISNTAIGNNALNAMNTGAYNTALGSDAGQNISSGNGNVLLGYRAGPATGGAQSNKLYIHNTASDNPLIEGRFNTRSLGINGSLALRPGASVITATSDNFSVNVESTSYLRVLSNDTNGSNRTLTLENGAYIGQVLVIEGTSDSNPVEIVDNSAVNNTNTSGTYILKQNDVITLLWNGTDWLEISYTDN